MHILSTGSYLYVSDQRFSVEHDKDNDSFLLTVTNITTKDMGDYECQVSGIPVISMGVWLDVKGKMLTIMER